MNPAHEIILTKKSGSGNVVTMRQKANRQFFMRKSILSDSNGKPLSWCIGE
jgi:hypothetical protein